jgi:hypothetical protein
MALKAKILTMFPALISASSPLTLVKDGISYIFGLDVAALRISLDIKGYGGTSTTSLTIGTGSKAFGGIAEGLAYLPGNYVRASSSANGANFMEGFVTSYAGGVITINVVKTGGAGTISAWNFALAGAPGAGDLISTNNLSDLAAKYTAKDTISIHGADIASAATVNLETATGDLVDVTGTTTITAITLSEGHERTVRFTGILTLTNGASLVLLTGANITTAAGDFAVFRGYAAGVVRMVAYERASGVALVGGNVVAANNGSEFTNPATFRTNLRVPVMGYVYGLVCASPFSGSASQFSVSAGEAFSSSGTDLMILASNYSKVGTAAWSVGTGGGAIDTGSLTANAFWYIYLIKRPDTGVVDICISLSANAPTVGGNIPSAYTLSQLIGAFKTDATPQIRGFYQRVNTFYYITPLQDYSALAVGTSRALATLSAPSNSTALFRAYTYNSGAAVAFLIQPTLETDRAPGAFMSAQGEVANQGQAGHYRLPVDINSQIALRASVAASSAYIETFGFELPG